MKPAPSRIRTAAHHGARRVLIVSPNWVPLNYPDLQRVRTMLPYLRSLGWEAEVLCVDADHAVGPRDAELESTVPSHIGVTRVMPALQRLAGRPGVPSARFRALGPLARAGDRLLARGDIDLVFFSTTTFPAMILGPLWKRRFGIPYVVDWQDPWYAGRFRRGAGMRVPGGRVKYSAAMAVARVLEPLVLRDAAHVVSVSPAYPASLVQHYSWLGNERFTVLPFGAPEGDFDQLRARRSSQTMFDPGAGLEHWVYAGRAGEEMRLPVRALCLALAQERAHQPAIRIRMHFLGTSYGTGADPRSLVRRTAEEYGIADLVHEHPERLPYLETLACLRDASLVLILGSADAGYNASKLYLNILARRPLLALLHKDSAMVDAIRRLRAGTVVPFDPSEDERALAARLRSCGLSSLAAEPPAVDWSAFEPFTARVMSERLCALFDSVVGAPRAATYAAGAPGA